MPTLPDNPNCLVVSDIDVLDLTPQHDRIPNIRVYCTQFKTAYTLQIRGTAPIRKDGRAVSRKAIQKNIVISARMSREDLKDLNKIIDQLLNQ